MGLAAGNVSLTAPTVDSLACPYYAVLNLTKECVMEGKPIVEITYCVP